MIQSRLFAEWSRYWQEEGIAGEIFLNPEGQPHPDISAFWQEQLRQEGQSEAIIDLASGAGSVLAHLPSSAWARAVALDLSASGLQLLRQRMPHVHTVVGSVTDPPFLPESFNLAVSQFGVEYGGIEALSRASELLAAGGRLVFLCHFLDGALDREHRAQLLAAREVSEAGFIDAATDLARAAFNPDPSALSLEITRFEPLEQTIKPHLKTCKSGVHLHLYHGFHKLFRNHEQYREEDITDWLHAMRGEVERSLLRLTAITGAALSESDTARFSAELQQSGFEVLCADPWFLEGGELPVAWKLTARRPAS